MTADPREHTWIAAQTSVEVWTAEVAASPVIALDTEFVREKTYYPKLCLIQIATDRAAACVDCLAPLDLNPLLGALFHPDRTWIVHSARQDPSEILAFKEAWGDRCPVIIVPTKYYNTPTEVFRGAGFSVVIWANHLMRSSLTAMQQTAREIFARQSLAEVEQRVAPLSEVFRLQDEPELAEAEKRYLPITKPGEPMVRVSGHLKIEEVKRGITGSQPMIPANGHRHTGSLRIPQGGRV